MTSPDTDELRRQIEAANTRGTPGPWAIDTEPGFEFHVRTFGTTTATHPLVGEPVADAALSADAAFIAAANPAAITVLLDAYEASVAREAVLLAENERLVDALNKALAENPETGAYT